MQMGMEDQRPAEALHKRHRARLPHQPLRAAPAPLPGEHRAQERPAAPPSADSDSGRAPTLPDATTTGVPSSS
jgi:hypothetical protein